MAWLLPRFLRAGALSLMSWLHYVMAKNTPRHRSASAKKAGLSRLSSGEAPGADPASLADIPPWLYPSFERAFGEAAALEGQGLAQRAPIDLRVNRLKVKPSTLLKSLDDLEILGPEGFPDALRIAPPQGPQKSPRLEGLEAYERGWFELQDLGSQIVSQMTGVKSGMQVLDLCAGSGGKTLAMAALMENKGQIHAYDIEAKRLAPINARLQRGGVHNVRVLPCNNQGVLDKLTGKMDVVLVDAPCTGSGTWRRKPDSKWRLTQDQLDLRLAEQQQVLEQGCLAVKSGGRLVYVTCSVLPQENSDQIEVFLKDHDEFSLLPYRDVWRDTGAKNELVSALLDKKYLQLTPANNGCDGFFIAVLQKS